MWAIASDIHANFEAFRAVLDDIDNQGVEKLFLLGDLVGYGPDPMGCIDLAMTFGTVALLGSSDCAVAHLRGQGLAITMDSSTRSLVWVHWLLSESGSDHRFQYPRSRQARHWEHECLFVHGTPREPLGGQIPDVDSEHHQLLVANFELIERVCFHGGSHVPGIILNRIDQDSPCDRVVSCDRFVLNRYRRTLIDVGSVGQPRDGDPRACYALFDGETVRYRRVEYDVEETIRQIHTIPELEPFFGDRLREGR